ncbi:uncharacterized protein PRCAT00005959001 [Priceomyces carsonii]|uniref:uncharacterized protein n=1 Tax=Priceomyces carsonii TaxID=28549 RepID=UPI002ED87FFF|nr:unnamed protein product [Priceomyces carsonii]
MSNKADVSKLVHHSLNTLTQLVESDTEITLIDLNLIENLNTNQSLNYINLEQSFVILDKDAKNLEQMSKLN